MIALDTNILVYSRRQESEHHAAALRLVTRLAEGDESWALPWPSVYEFIRVVTHPRVFDPPTSLPDVLADLESLLESPSLVLLGEGPFHPGHMMRCVDSGQATGNLAHDAHIAALAMEHGVSALWTTDRDFARFPGLTVHHPFVDGSIHEPRSRYRARSRRTR